jgi:hypothetical protein
MKCACIPFWFSQATVLLENNQCSHCEEPLSPSVSTQLRLLPCSLKKTTVHMSSVVVHTKCVKAYLKFMMKKQRHLLFDMYPMCPSQEARKMVDQLRKSCLTIHHTPGRYCSNCGTGEQEHVRLLTCSKCLETHYCDADCQKRDYELHKEFCFIYRPLG